MLDAVIEKLLYPIEYKIKKEDREKLEKLEQEIDVMLRVLKDKEYYKLPINIFKHKNKVIIKFSGYSDRKLTNHLGEIEIQSSSNGIVVIMRKKDNALAYEQKLSATIGDVLSLILRRTVNDVYGLKREISFLSNKWRVNISVMRVRIADMEKASGSRKIRNGIDINIGGKSVPVFYTVSTSKHYLEF